MDNNLLIVGAGAYGYVVKEIAGEMGIFDKISFVDDNAIRDDVVGTSCQLNSFVNDYKYAIVAIGNPNVRKETILMLGNIGYEIPILIHPKAYVSKSAKLGLGCVIEPMSVIHSNAVVGEGCLICAGSIINHNAQIEDFCQIDCNAVIGAGAFVPEGTKVMYGEVVFKK